MIKETDDQGSNKYKYVKCPACGSKKRHFEGLSETAIKMRSAKPGYLIAFMLENRLIGDPEIIRSLPLGTEIPSVISAIDICMDCGCVYAPMVITGKAKVTSAVKPSKLILPGQ